MADIAGFGVQFDTSDVRRGADEVDASMTRVAQAAARGAAGLDMVPPTMRAHVAAAEAAAGASGVLSKSLDDITGSQLDLNDASHDAAEAITEQASAHNAAAASADGLAASEMRLGRAFSDNEMRSGRLKFMMENVLLSMSGLSGMGIHLAATFGIIAAGVETAMVVLAGMAVISLIAKSVNAAYDDLGKQIDKATESTVQSAQANQDATTNLALMQQGVKRANEEVALGPKMWQIWWQELKNFFDGASEGHATLGLLGEAIATIDVRTQQHTAVLVADSAAAEAAAKVSLTYAANLSTTASALLGLQDMHKLNTNQMELAQDVYAQSSAIIAQYSAGVQHGAADLKILNDALKANQDAWKLLYKPILDLLPVQEANAAAQKKLTDSFGLLAAARNGGVAGLKAAENAQADEAAATATAEAGWKHYTSTLTGANGVVGENILTTTSLSLALYNQDPVAKQYVANELARAAATRLNTDAAQEAQAAETALAAAKDNAGKLSAELAKSVGDETGAINANLAVTLHGIDVKNLEIKTTLAAAIAKKSISAATLDASAQTEKDTATLVAHAEILAIVAKQAAAYKAQNDEIAASEAANAVLQAQVDGNYAAAAVASLQEKHDAITRVTDATIAATNAQDDLTGGQKLWADVLTMVHGLIQQHGVDLQDIVNKQTAEKGLLNDLEQAEGDLSVAQLKASGNVMGAKKEQLALENEMYALKLRENALYQSDPEYKNLADQLIMLHDQIAAANEQAAAVSKLKSAYTDMATDMDRTVRKAFEDVFSQGTTDWATFFTNIKTMFEKLLGDMAAAAIEKDVGGLLLQKGKGMTGGAGGANPMASPAGYGDDLFGGELSGIGVPGMIPTSGGANPVGADPVLMAGLAVGGLLVGGISDIIDAGQKLQAARVAWRASAADFDKSLTDFTTSIGVAANSLAAAFAASTKQIDAQNTGAFSTFTSAPGAQGSGLSAGITNIAATAAQAYATGGIPALTQLEQLMLAIADKVGNVKDTQEAIDQLNKDLGITAADAAKLTQADLVTWIQGITAAFDASIPVIGGALTTINGIIKTATDAIADAQGPGGDPSQIGAIQLTETNNLTAAFNSYSAATLDALINSNQLSGSVLDLAQTIDVATHAAEDAAATLRNNTTVGGLDARLATATATSDPAASAAYAAAARAQQEEDEMLKAQAQLNADVTANAGPAVIAQDNYIIALTATTQAAEDAATAAAAQAAAQKLVNDTAESQASSKYRIAVAQGNVGLAKTYADLMESQKETDDYNTALANGLDKTTASMIASADAAEYLAQTQADAAAAAKASRDYNGDLASRNAALTPLNAQLATSADYLATKNANLLLLQNKQVDSLNDMISELNAGTISQSQFNDGIATMKAEYDSAAASFDGSIGGVTSAVHDLAVAAQILSDNTSSLSQQWDVFGTSLDDQVTSLAKLYGFTGMSDDQITALFTQTTAGQELTDSQVALNKEIQTYIDLERSAASADAQSAAADASSSPTAAAATPSTAASVTFGSTTPIIGPGGTFYTNVTVQVDPNTIKNGQAIGDAIVKRLDTAWATKANLIRDASGQT